MNAVETIYVVEGCKDVETLTELGLTATTTGGANDKWKPEHVNVIPSGCEIVILPDNDEPGRLYAESVKDTLLKRGCRVKVVTLPDVPEHGDVSDWLSGGRTKEELLTIVAATEYWISETEEKTDTSEPDALPWPEKMADEAFSGLAGEIVEGILPYTEAGKEALLADVLINFGNIIGRTAHIKIGNSKHHCNEFACLVGPTSSGRKGTSRADIKPVFDAADATWVA